MRRAEQLAYEADICLNSAVKALRHGAKSLRGRPGERAAEVMDRHGWKAEAAPPTEAPPPRRSGAAPKVG